MLTDFREREREGEREGEKHLCERETLISCPLYTPWPGTQPVTRYLCPDLESDLEPFGLWDDAPTN